MTGRSSARLSVTTAAAAVTSAAEASHAAAAAAETTAAESTHPTAEAASQSGSSAHCSSCVRAPVSAPHGHAAAVSRMASHRAASAAVSRMASHRGAAAHWRASTAHRSARVSHPAARESAAGSHALAHSTSRHGCCPAARLAELTTASAEPLPALPARHSSRCVARCSPGGAVRIRSVIRSQPRIAA